MFKYIGWLIILWGLADLAVSWADIDLWAQVGVYVPDSIYPYTHYIAFAIGGAFLMIQEKISGDNSDDDE